MQSQQCLIILVNLSVDCRHIFRTFRPMKSQIIEHKLCACQVCGAGRTNSIRHRSPTGRPALRWPRKRSRRILPRPDPAHRRRNCPTCCKCCRIRAAHPASRSLICSTPTSSSNETNDTPENNFHFRGIRRFLQLFVRYHFGD